MRVLQAEQIEELAVAINQIAGAGDALAVGLDQVRDGAARIPGRFEHLDALDGIAAAHGAGDGQRLGQNAAGLIGVIVEALGAILLPEIRHAREQILFGLGRNAGRAARRPSAVRPRPRRGDDA